MHYKTFVRKVAKTAGTNQANVRKVLAALPPVLMSCEENERIFTPLGAFKLVRRRRKRVLSPSGHWSFAPERLQVQLKPGPSLLQPLEAAVADPALAPKGREPVIEPPEPGPRLERTPPESSPEPGPRPKGARPGHGKPSLTP